MSERCGGGERRVEVRSAVGIGLAGLERPCEVYDRVGVGERDLEVVCVSERSHLVGQVTETMLQRGTDLSTRAGHSDRTRSPRHERRLPVLIRPGQNTRTLMSTQPGGDRLGVV